MSEQASAFESHWLSLAKHQRSERAFAQLVKLHQSALRYSLLQLSNYNEPLVDDVIQESLLKAWQALPRFNEQARFFTWLYRIAHNELVSVYRKQGPITVSSDTLLQEPAVSPDMALHRDIAKALAGIELPRRSVLHLHLHRQLSHSEIAETLGLPLGTVKTHINRGRDQLKQALSHTRISTQQEAQS